MNAIRKLWMVIIGTVALGAASAQQKNIKLIDKVAGPGSAHVAINRKEPQNWVASLTNRIIYTLDGGKNWSSPKIKLSLANYGDSFMTSNGKGEFVFIQSAGPGKNAIDSVRNRLVSRSTNDGGVTWTEESFSAYRPPHGQGYPMAGADKGTLYLTWTEFDHDLPKDSVCTANILFSISSSEGKKWSDPITINTEHGPCLEHGQGMQSSSTSLNADGKLFVLWSNQGATFLDRSYDGGKTWLNNDLAISRVIPSPVEIPGVQRTLAAPTLAVDKSMSYFRGSLYAVWASQSGGLKDMDIWFARSTNRGDFWTEPQRISKDTTHRQRFLSSLVVDEVTGIIYVAYYDRRGADDWQTDVYLAYSIDGGSGFKEVKITENSIVPTPEVLLAGPVALDVYKGVIMVAWTGIQDGTSSLWISALKQSELIKKEEVPRLQQIHRR